MSCISHDNCVKFIHLFQPDNMTLIRKLETILIRLLSQNVSLLFNDTYLHERLLPNYTHIHTHTNTHTYTYIYIYIYIWKPINTHIYVSKCNRKSNVYINIYIYIYIVIHRQTVSFYQNSSVWLDTQDARSRDRNPSTLRLTNIYIYI